MQVRSREVPRHPRSSPPAYGEIRASKRGVEPSLRKAQPASPQRKAKSAASLVDARKGATGSRARHDEAKAMEGVKCLEMQPRRTRRRKGRGMVGQSSWEQERPVSAPTVRLDGNANLSEWIGSAKPYKHWTREVGESGAGVGAAHSTEDGADNRTASEGRGRTWSACSAEVSVGECP
jgi:hypothetical protein